MRADGLLDVVVDVESRGAADFVFFQFFARAFIAGETMLAIVVITEAM